MLMKYCQSEWPPRSNIASSAKPYIPVANELSVYEGILLRGNQIVIPTSIRQEIHTVNMKELQNAEKELVSQYGGRV